MYASFKFKSEKAARSQVEPLQIQPLLMIRHDGRRWLRFKTLQQSFFARWLATRLQINVWSKLHYDIAGLIGCCIAAYIHVLDGCNGTTRARQNVCSYWYPDSYTYFRQPLLQLSCPWINRGWICRRSTWLFAASSDLNLNEVYIIGFLKVCSLLL